MLAGDGHHGRPPLRYELADPRLADALRILADLILPGRCDESC